MFPQIPYFKITNSTDALMLSDAFMISHAIMISYCWIQKDETRPKTFLHQEHKYLKIWGTVST